MEKLESLSKEQEKLLPVIRDKWVNLALGGNDDFNVETFQKGITFIYGLANLTDPIKIYVDSPLGVQYACQMLKKIDFGKLKSDQVNDQVSAQVRAQVYDQVSAQVYAQVNDQVSAQVSTQVNDQVSAQVYAQVYDQVNDQVSTQVRDQVYAQVSAQVSTQVNDQVYAQVSAQVYDQVSTQVSAQVYAQVYDQVSAQVYAQVNDQVSAQVYAQVSAQVSTFALLGMGWDTGLNSFYDYFDEVKVKVTKNWKQYKTFLDSGVWDTVMFNNFAIGCRRPNKVMRNIERQLHCADGSAIEWRDGFKLHYLNGVFFSEKLYKDVTSGKMKFEKIMAIKDIDQRTQAMRFGDVDKFLKHVKARKLDTYVKMRPDNKIVHYALYEIPKGDIFTTDAYYMVYDDPSTDKQYMSGVDKFATAPEAMAWKSYITVNEWKSLVPLVTES